MPIQIIISQADQYQVADMDLWKIKIGNKICRDIPIDSNKILKCCLIDLLKHAGVRGLTGLKKDELVQLFNQWYVFQ